MDCVLTGTHGAFAARLEAAQKGQPCDDSEEHQVISQVLDFVCGAVSPPAPAPKTYMERSLAENMVPFQSQMTQEVSLPTSASHHIS